jgi:hypothetical protein
MNKPIFPKPKCAAAAPKAEAERQRRRTCTKAADLRGALVQLLEARALAGEESEPTGDRK